MIIQLHYLVRSDEAEKIRNEIERQLIDDNRSILYIDDDTTIKRESNIDQIVRRE